MPMQSLMLSLSKHEGRPAQLSTKSPGSGLIVAFQ
jgi:hypothetical protein